MELEVVETGRFGVHTDLKIARDRRNLAVRGFARLADPDAFTFRIHSEIPLSGGLGTSAAAYVAGLMAADHLFELDADLLALATELEGHPDNVAAALHGGFVICADGEATRFEPPTGLEAVVVVPGTAVRTKTARAALPAAGADRRRGVQHGPRRAARARPGARGLGPRRARARRPPAPAAPRSTSTRARWRSCAARARSGRWGRRSRAPGRPCSCGATTRPPAASSRRCAARPRAGRQVMRVPFESQGADVREL